MPKAQCERERLFQLVYKAAEALLHRRTFQLYGDLQGGRRFEVRRGTRGRELMLCVQCVAFRQDAVVMQLVSVMDAIWQKNGHDLRMKLFRCLPTGQKCGLIEMVAECRTFREIQAAQG